MIVGTSTTFVSETDFGGSVPKWIIRKFAPQGHYEFCDELVQAAKENDIK